MTSSLVFFRLIKRKSRINQQIPKGFDTGVDGERHTKCKHPEHGRRDVRPLFDVAEHCAEGHEKKGKKSRESLVVQRLNELVMRRPFGHLAAQKEFVLR